MQKAPINTLVMALFISTSVIATPSLALDFGKALEDAAKQKIDESLGQDKHTNETAPASPQESAPTAKPVETTAISVNTTEATMPEKPAINWKKPSKEEEIALGREITGSILGAAPLVKDEALQKYVNQVGRWVASQSERADLPWKFGVIESADLNAFAAPGGYVLITKGLYQKLQNEAQLAGVLGHEIAHIVKKHHLKVLQKQQLLNIGAGLITDKFGKNDQLAKQAIGHGAEISARSLDKDAEFEADRMGVVLATRAGYDTFGLPEVLQTVGQTNKTDNSVALLYKTHPHPDERLAKLGESAGSKLDNVKAGKTLENRFYKLK
ncbi:MAG: M48 family metalloprotease [Methylophilaceae bacterium]